MKKLVVIPTYNEAGNVEKLINGINAQAVTGLDILVVDDNSPDGTAAAVQRLSAAEKNIYLLKRGGKIGFASAYIEGFRWALKNNYDLIVQMDADLSHDPADLPKIIAAAEKYDLVIGSRYAPEGGISGWPIFRKFLSAFGNWYARTILSVEIRDFTGGYNAWRTEVLKKINFDSIKANGYGFLIELKYRAAKNNFSFKEIPIIFKERTEGKSKMSGAIIFEAAWQTVKLRLDK